jgi:uncharacterized protein (TIGR03118 family)
MKGSATKRSIIAAIAVLTVARAGLAQTAGANVYLQQNLVANAAGAATFTDPNLVDPWGLSFSGASPFWVSNHLSGTATVYTGTAGTVSTLVVTIPPGAASAAGSLGRPTGQVQNSVPAASKAFLLPGGNPASFIFATEDGTISAWNGGAAAIVTVDNSKAGAVYKGLALNPSATAPLLYAANFNSGKIDVFNSTFSPTTVAGGFADPNIPAGFAPFNIWPVNGKLYVMYAKQDANKFLDVAGAGNGYVDVFDFNGNLLTRLVSGVPLNSPWGVAQAPAGWGAFGGAILIGNFGDGTINAFDPTSGKQLGTLQNASGTPISVTGLWAILFGNGGRGGDSNALYFTAGVPSGSSQRRGLFGSIAPPAAITGIFNSAGDETGAIAPGEIVVITGQSVGPAPIVSAALPAAGTVATALSGVSATFNGLPAPVVYTLATQTAVIVPYGVAGSQTASVVLTNGTQKTAAFSIPVAGSVPGLFTISETGTGNIVALNQDGTVNSTTNAAARGTVVVLYATGEGVTNPAGVDGLIAGGNIFREPVLPVALTIGGVTAQVLYAGSSPGNVAGVMEVEAIVPTGAQPGADSVMLSVGGVSSQTNATLNVK